MMVSAFRNLPIYVKIMLLVGVVLVTLVYFSPVQIMSASCSIGASAALIGVCTSLRKEPDNLLARIFLAAMYWLFVAFALLPFVAYFD